MTGCSFAGLAANREGGILMAPFPGIAYVNEIDGVLELAGIQRLPAIVVLPGIRTESQLVDQLLVRRTLARVSRTNTGRARDRRCVRGPRVADCDAGPLVVADGARSSWNDAANAEGPYTCIAAWTGERLNRFRKGTDPVVHFLDADLSQYRLNDKKYGAGCLIRQRDADLNCHAMRVVHCELVREVARGWIGDRTRMDRLPSLVVDPNS